MKVTKKSIVNLKDINQVVEKISAHLQKAIVVENKNFELIAYSSPSAFSFDPVQQKTILTKRCPLYVIERLKKEGVVERLENEHYPIRLNRMEDIHFYERVVISLKHDGRLYGYLWIYEAAMLMEEEFAFLAEIAPHLGKILFEKQYIAKTDQQAFIWKLMNHEFLNEAEMYQAAKMVSFKVPKACTVVVYSVNNAQYVYVLEKIKSYFKQEKIAHYLGKGTEIIGLIAADEASESQLRAVHVLQEVQALLTDDEYAAVFIGVGEAYERINHIRKSYLEALEVIETMVFLNVEEQMTFYFRELGLYRYMKIMYKKNIADQYRNNDIIELMKKDAANNSELIKTLGCFLKNDCKVAKTAENLFIHPNTMNYRLKQIAEVITIDFTDMQAKMELYIELQLLHYVSDYRNY